MPGRVDGAYAQFFTKHEEFFNVHLKETGDMIDKKLLNAQVAEKKVSSAEKKTIKKQAAALGLEKQLDKKIATALDRSFSESDAITLSQQQLQESIQKDKP